MHPALAKFFGYESDAPDGEIIADWRQRTRELCKPCWELKYCPYGPLVEQSPFPPSRKSEAIAHHKHLMSCLANGRFPDGRKLDAKRRKLFEAMTADFHEEDNPDDIPPLVEEVSCRVFGHMCPVFYCAEPLTETKDRRKHSRLIPREVMLKVVRRDGQICQKCHEPVPDDQVEFDHVIPFSKGGTSTADNIRLLCRDCNREKGDSLESLLSPNPIEHYFELQEKSIRKRNK
jgi:5-methylcytosine-specific restriction endonuclease McrA